MWAKVVSPLSTPFLLLLWEQAGEKATSKSEDHVPKSLPHGEYFVSNEKAHPLMAFVCCLPACTQWLQAVLLHIHSTRLMGSTSAWYEQGMQECAWPAHASGAAPMHRHPARVILISILLWLVAHQTWKAWDGCRRVSGCLCKPGSRRGIGFLAVGVPLNGSGSEESPAPMHGLPLQ